MHGRRGPSGRAEVGRALFSHRNSQNQRRPFAVAQKSLPYVNVNVYAICRAGYFGANRQPLGPSGRERITVLRVAPRSSVGLVARGCIVVDVIDDLAVRDAVEDLVLDVCSIMSEYEPIQGVPGTCIGCGTPGAALRQCLSCGAPVEPDDESWHYSFGWVEGPRPD